jgi:hypothetical protein
MAISRVNVVATSSLNANAITAAAANTMYEGRATFDPAIYTITCASGVITNFEFYSNASTLITTGVTSSGTVAINLSSTADRIRLWTNTGTDTVVTITKTAAAITNAFSGTLDTVTTVGTSTYTGTSASGFAYAILFGGGGGGGHSSGANGARQGGLNGGRVEGLVTLTGSMTVVIGAGGGSAAIGGNSTFAGWTAGGGGYGSTGGNSTVAGNASSGGTYSGITGTPVYQFVKSGSTGNGGAFTGAINAGSGSGIGTGGSSGASGNNGSAGTGYAAGGGGGNAAGGAGTQGVLYVLRF